MTYAFNYTYASTTPCYSKKSMFKTVFVCGCRSSRREHAPLWYERQKITETNTSNYNRFSLPRHNIDLRTRNETIFHCLRLSDIVL